MGWYSRFVFPRICELALNNRRVAPHRTELLSQAQGEILEIGIGSGLNVAHYPSHVRRITAIDPNPGMHRWAEDRIAATQLEVDKRVLKSEALPFDTGTFDCVVSTFTLCSIDGVDQALGEIFRVLKPGGKFLFLEHGLSPDPGVQRWQHRLNGLERLLADNCHLNRDVRELVSRQPFSSVALESYYMKKTPKTHGYFSQGAAIK